MSAVASAFPFRIAITQIASLHSPLPLFVSSYAILTVHFQLNDLSNARANAIVRLAQVESFAILLDVLQQHGAVAEQLGEGTFAHLLVFA